MFVCLLCTPHVVCPKTNPFEKSRLRFGSQDAYILLKSCNSFKHLKQIHTRIIRHGLSQDQLLIRKMIELCSTYGKMEYAYMVFNQVEHPQIFTWNIMIREYTVNGCFQRALLLFNLIICQGVAPDKFTFPFVIKACAAASEIDKGKEVHGLASKTGFYGDMFVQHTLIDLYLKCGIVDYGCKVFEKMRVHNVVSWTTMVAGLVSCGELDTAREFFEKMPVRNLVSWTAMIDGYVRKRQPEEAFELFWRMMLDNVQPNEFTLVSLLRASVDMGSLNLGRWLHEFALKNGFKIGAFLGTALIDMYSKCGSLDDASQVFNEMQHKTVATWNSMITSLGVHGYGAKALLLFKQMEEAEVRPDAITFVGVLSACVHVNDVEKGFMFFQHMRERYGITPLSEHYTCMFELYSRASMLKELSSLLSTMPPELHNLSSLSPWASDVDGQSDKRKLFYSQDMDLNNLRSHQHHLSQHQLRCFKWDVG